MMNTLMKPQNLIAATTADMRTLLLQFRNDPNTIKQEHASFVEKSGLKPSQIDTFNTFHEKEFNPAKLVDGYDAVFLGGSSSANVLKPKEYPFITPSIEFLKYCLNAERPIPVMSSCFGFQLAILALGGEILHHETDFEMGVIPIHLTPLGRQDHLLHTSKRSIPVISVHKQYALNLPNNCDYLAYSDFCIHAFKVSHKPFWAFQFHPEIDLKTFEGRLRKVKDQYSGDDEQRLTQTFQNVVETPQANRIVRRFVDYVAKYKAQAAN